jgi:Raf kinase inhibitor-like YbhB/YbcL family protein
MRVALLAAILATPVLAHAAGFSIASPSFEESTAIPRDNTCDGKNFSPPLAWRDAPAGVKAFALVVDDPDAPGGTFVHWVLYDVPATVTSLTAGDSGGGKQGKNGFGKTGYGGPCPPPGGSHHYRFHVYALDRPTGLEGGATKEDVLKAIDGHTLADATLTGTYGR